MRGLAVGGGLLALLAAVAIMLYLAVGSNSPTGGGSTGGSVQTALDAQKHVQVEVTLASVRQAIQAYWALNNKYPDSLDDLAKNIGRLPKPPPGMTFHYDPATGTVDCR